MALSLVDNLLGQYTEYFETFAAQGYHVVGFGEWYEQRDYDPDEPRLTDEELAAIVANDPDPICRACGAECVPYTVDHAAFTGGDGMIFPSWACPSCRLLWDDDQVFA